MALEAAAKSKKGEATEPVTSTVDEHSASSLSIGRAARVMAKSLRVGVSGVTVKDEKRPAVSWRLDFATRSQSRDNAVQYRRISLAIGCSS